MKRFRTLNFLGLWLLCIINFTVQAESQTPITPTEVFIEAKAIKNIIALLATRDKQRLTIPQVDIDVENAEPRHVYSMAVALNEKVCFYLSLKGQKSCKKPPYPSEKIVPGLVFKMVQTAQENLKLASTDITLQREAAKDKKPADVIRELTYANLWMDELLQDSFVPSHVFRFVSALNGELDNLTKSLGISPLVLNPSRYENLKPKDAFSTAGNFYRVLARFDSARFNSTGVTHPYNIPSSGIAVKPIHVFTLTIFNLNFLYSVELKLGINPESSPIPELQEGVKPAEVYQGYDLANAKLAYLISNLGKR